MYIHGTYIVYYILHRGQVAGVAEEGRGAGAAPTHLRGSAYILSCRHGHARVHARTSARPRTPERASTLR